MASRKKRDLVATAGEPVSGVGGVAGNALQDPATAPGAESPTPVVEVIAGSPEAKPVDVPTAPKSKSTPRKGRPRKRTADPVPADVGIATPAPILEPPPPPPAPPWTDASESLRQVLEQCTQVQDQLRILRQDLQEAAKEVAEVSQRSLTVKQELAEVGDAIGQLHQVRMVREELQEALREAGQVKEQSLVVKQEVLATEGALDGLRQSLDRTQALREALESAVGEVDQVKARSLGVKQELLDTEGSVAAIRQALDTLGEDMKNQFREASTQFLTMGESCQDLQRELREAREQTAALPPAQPAPEPAVVVSDADTQTNTPLASVTAGPGTEVMLELPPPSPNPPTNGSSHEGKTWLGITVDAQAMVIDVLPDSPAERAGVLRGDTVVEADGKPIANSEDLRLTLEQAEPDKDIKLTVMRGQEKQDLTVHLAEALVP